MNGSGSGFVVLSNTANSFSGGVSIAGNTAGRTYDVSVPQIGNAGGSSPLGTSGTVNIGGSNGFAMLTWTGTTAETTNKVVNLTNTASGVAAIENNGIGRLTFTSDFTVSSPGAKQLSFFGTGTTEIASRIVDVSPGAATRSSWTRRISAPRKPATNCATIAVSLPSITCQVKPQRVWHPVPAQNRCPA